MGQPRGRQFWTTEVDAWRASDESAARFASARGYSQSSLLKWSSTLRRRDDAHPAFVRVELARTPAAPGLVVEVGRARIALARGFDPELLRAVVDALDPERRQ